MRGSFLDVRCPAWKCGCAFLVLTAAAHSADDPVERGATRGEKVVSFPTFVAGPMPTTSSSNSNQLWFQGMATTSP